MSVLDGLDQVDWSKLAHAYGPAADVPALIRALVSPEPLEREAAYQELFGNIWHQGTVYEASARALPFLIDLLASERTPDRDTLAVLVASIMGGRGYCEIHFAKNRINPFTGKPVDPSFDIDARLREEKNVVAQVRGQGARAIPLLVPYLKHPDLGVRSDIARALAWYPSEFSTIVPALERALLDEADEEAREMMQAALRELANGPG
ncbi:MAG: HEAT repeat domain-containing protein [Polyangiales bacterium]